MVCRFANGTAIGDNLRPIAELTGVNGRRQAGDCHDAGRAVVVGLGDIPQGINLPCQARGAVENVPAFAVVSARQCPDGGQCRCRRCVDGSGVSDGLGQLVVGVVGILGGRTGSVHFSHFASGFVVHKPLLHAGRVLGAGQAVVLVITEAGDAQAGADIALGDRHEAACDVIAGNGAEAANQCEGGPRACVVVTGFRPVRGNAV